MSEKCVVVDKEQILTFGSLDAEVVASCKTKVLFAMDNLDLWIALFNNGGFVILGGIIYHNHFQRLVIERDGINQCAGIGKSIIIDGNDRCLNSQFSILNLLNS